MSNSDENASRIKFKKLAMKVIKIIVANHVKTTDPEYPLFNNEILNGIVKKRGRKLKNDNADLPKTKLTIVERLIGNVSNGFTLITGSF